MQVKAPQVMRKKRWSPGLFKQRRSQRALHHHLSSNICLMAKGMKSDVMDDESKSPSIDELLDLVHEHQKVINN